MGKQLMAGIGKLMITSPFDCEMSGFIARKGRSRGMHDPLWARALVLSYDNTKLALVTVDLIGVDRYIMRETRKIIANMLDLSPSSIIVCASHTHSGPATLREAYLGEVDPGYLSGLAANIAGAVYTASCAMEPVEILVGEGKCSYVGKNRRRKGGPTDPQVIVLRVQRIDEPQIPKALLVNYACHPVVLGPNNLLITADYPYYMIRALEQVYIGAQVMMVNGACGDVNAGHTTLDSIKEKGGSNRTFEEAKRLGQLLAGEALRASEQAILVEPLDINYNLQEICLPLEPLPEPSDLYEQANAWDHLGHELKAKGVPYGEYRQAEVWADWARTKAQQIKDGQVQPSITTEIAAFSIGDLDFVSFPGEFFHDFALMIKKDRSPRKVFVLGYCNDNIGYVAPEYAYNEGGYEVEDSFRYYGHPSRLKRGSGERVVDALSAILQGF
jgi:neutral ceramidase